jgi:hypothetical protein
MRKFVLKFIIFVLLMVQQNLLAQPTKSVRDTIQIDSITVYGKQKNVSFKKQGLYDQDIRKKKKSIRDFTALDLYTDGISDEIWKTINNKCITMVQGFDRPKNGDSYLNLKWDKVAGGCNWIGMGIGWDGWSGKDLSTIYDTAALELYVRSKDVNQYNLPLALGIEDHNNQQIWIGFSAGFIENGVITKEWTKITIPLQLFNFDDDQFDGSNVKQLIIQFESSGLLDVDAIQLVPFSGKMRNEIVATSKNSNLKIDGLIQQNEWNAESFCTINKKHQIAVQHDKENLYFGFKIVDSSPLVNQKEGKDIWDGDAIEIAFGANPSANPKRKFYLLSDTQLGIRMNEKPIIWNWKTNTLVENGAVKYSKVNDGYFVEIQIPIKEICGKELESLLTYGFEVGIDQGDEKGKRTHQDRWNNPSADGFNVNPSLWGHLKLD